jgi:transcriptional regulator with XRE-family HTH domain
MPRKKWSEIRAKASPEVLAGAEEVLTSLRLADLRRARNLTQETVAERLSIRQVSVSRMESRGDVRVSTLRSVVTAMGGTLDVLARFPDAVYRIAFDDGEADARVEPFGGPNGTESPVVEFATAAERRAGDGRA